MNPAPLAPGLWRWTAAHPGWKPNGAPGSTYDWPQHVGCVLYKTQSAAIFVDPLIDNGAARFWAWADAHCADREVVVLTTIAFHKRSRELFVERYGARTPRAKQAMPTGVRSVPLRGARERVLWIAAHRTLIVGDSLLGAEDGTLTLSPPAWLRYTSIDQPTLRRRLTPLLDLDIERILVSHGPPILHAGRAALAAALGQPL